MAATQNVDPLTTKETPAMSTAIVSQGDVEHVAPKQTVSLWSYLMADVDPAQTTAPLAAYCFMTGYM
jgi:hypothetical protein